MIENKKAKRIWFISDTHLGLLNNSNEWMDIMRGYFFDWFFPLVESQYQEGDILVHLGDWYESRQSVNLKVLDLGVQIAERMSSIFKDGIYVLIGNHDVWGKSSNNINSLKSIKWIPNLNVIQEHETLVFGGKTFFMMPWQKDRKTERETLAAAEPHDYLCCHAHINGTMFNRYVKVKDSAEPGELKKFGRVYTGHTHYTQVVDQIRVLGCPYELYRSDMDNPKFILRLDLDTGRETVFKNDYTPKYKKYTLQQILDKTPEELDLEFRNNFVDIVVDPSFIFNAPISIISDEVETQRNLIFIPSDQDNDSSYIDETYDPEALGELNILDMIKLYIGNTEKDESTRDNLIKSLTLLYNKASKEES